MSEDEDLHAQGRCDEASPCEHGWPGCTAPRNCPKCVRAIERRRVVAFLRQRYGRPGARTHAGQLLSMAAHAFADEIEAGRHLEEP